MNKYNTDYEYKQVNSRFLYIDPDYQRSLDMNRVHKIVGQFDEMLVNPIKVSLREGKYYVFDGQHTLAALKLRNNNKDLPVSCKVYKGMTRQQEAALFAQQNGLSRAVPSNAKLKAMYLARDPEVVDFYDCTNRVVKMDFSGGMAQNKILACAKAFKIYKDMGKVEYINILNIIESAWGGEPNSFRQEILGGLHLFYKEYRGKISIPALIKKLSRVSPLTIIRDGRLLSTGKDNRFKQQIQNIYNRRLRDKI